MSKKSKHKPKGPRNPPQNTPKKQTEVKEEPADVVQQPLVVQPPIVQDQPQIKEEKVPQPISEKPKVEPVTEKPPIQQEDNSAQTNPSPVKPKRNRGNRKKKNEGSTKDDGEEDLPAAEVTQPKSEELPAKKEVAKVLPPPPEVKKVIEVKTENKSEKEPDQKVEPKSKKGGKKDKNVQKTEQATGTQENNSSALPQCEKIVADVKTEAVLPVTPPIDDENNSAFTEAKGGKNKRGKNKKNKETPTDDVITPAKDNTTTDIKEVKEEAKKDIPETPVPSAITTTEQAEPIVDSSVQKNKKGKKEPAHHKQHKETPQQQSKTDSQPAEIPPAAKTEEKEIKVEDKKGDAEKPSKCTKPAENKSKPEKVDEKISETADDILPSLASSIEKTLEQLIVCESDIVLGEQLKVEEDKKEKNKKKSKKDKEKHVENVEVVEEKNVGNKDKSDNTSVQPEVKTTPIKTEIGTDVAPEEKSKPIIKEIDVEKKEPVVVEVLKTPETEVKHLVAEEKRASSKSPMRKDKRKKSPRPPKAEEKSQDNEPKPIVEPPAVIPQKEEIACAMKKEETTPCEKNKEGEKKKKDKHKNAEQKSDDKIVLSSVTEDIINTLLSDAPPPFIQEEEKLKCEINTPEAKISTPEVKNENKTVACEKKSIEPSCPVNVCEKPKKEACENVCKIQKSLPVELDSELGSCQIDSNIEKEMKKALEVAIGVIVGNVPIDGGSNVLTESTPACEKNAAEKLTEEHKPCDKDTQNKQEAKGKSKKNKNKHQHQDTTSTPEKEEKPTDTPKENVANVQTPEVPPVTSCPLVKPPEQPSVTSNIEVERATAVASPAEAAPIITPSVETCTIAAPPPVISPSTITLPIEIHPIEKENIEELKQSKDSLKEDELKPQSSPKPQKRNKDKKNKHGKGGDDAKTAQAPSGHQGQQQQQGDQKEKQTSETDKKQSDSEKNKEEKKQSDNDSQKSQKSSKGEKDSSEAAPSSDVSQPSNSPKENFEFLPIPDSCIKVSQLSEGKSNVGKDGKPKRKSPPKNQPKNLLGPSNIPAKSNKYDYKKEKNKDADDIGDKCAEVKMRTVDARDLPEPKEKVKQKNQILPESAGPSAKKAGTVITEIEDGSFGDDEDEEFVYKYSFRTVFISNACHICKVSLKDDRVVCRFCHLVSYCGEKHRDDDWQTHQSLCYAICTISHAKEQNYIYGDAKSLNGHDYRLLRMQTIVSCEKMLKRKLCPWEQEALLYPRICSLPSCREWKSGLLKDCEGCGQVSYCSSNPAHLPADHINWCKSYKLYYKLVAYQLNFGRLEPQLPVKIPPLGYQLPDKCTALFEDLYDHTINLDDCNFATLTQLSTAPLTALYAYQKYTENNVINCASKENMVNGTDNALKQNFCVHLIGAELQFEGDTLKKWEVFFLHFLHHVKELTIVLIGPELNTSKLPVELLSKIKLCQLCRQEDRKIKFDFIEGTLYHDYVESQNFIRPDLICAFNPGFHRATGYAGLDTWPETIASALRLRVPVCASAYTSHEMPRDLERVKVCAPTPEKLRILLSPGYNPYGSLRPDRNFVSDDEMPLIFKNYHVMVVAG